jgi:hypothetical protein
MSQKLQSQYLLKQLGGNSFDICVALRRIILAALKDDLPDGLYPYQTRVSDRVFQVTLDARGEELIVNQARQSGKTEAMVISILALALYYTKVAKEHLRIGVFAPASSQSILVVKERLRRRCMKLRSLLESLGIKLVTGDSVYSELFVIRNVVDNIDARVRCLSIGEKSNVTSETLHLTIIEQCEDVDPLKMTQEVFPMSAAVGGARILDGTPKSFVVNTYFYDAVTKRESRKDIISVDWHEAAKYNGKYADYVQQERDRLGEESIAFKTQYELQWVLGVDKFASLEDMQALSRKRPLMLPMVDGKVVFKLFGGWDVAKEKDRSVITFGYGEGDHAHIVEWMEFAGTDYTEQSQHVAQRCVELSCSQMCVDAAGVGDPVIDIFKRELRKYEGGAKVEVKGILTNNIKEEDITSKLLVNVWRNRLLDYPSQEEAAAQNNRQQRDRFIREFLDLNMLWKGNLLHLEAPQGWDKHDDYAKSCGLFLRSALKPPVKITIRAVEI